MVRTRDNGLDQAQRRHLGRVVWASIAAVVAFVGLAGAVVLLHADVVRAAIVDGALVSVVFLGVRQAALTDSRSGQRARLARTAVTIVSVSAVGAVALAGLFRLAGPFALAVLAVLGLTYLVVFRSPKIVDPHHP